jgi:hypothetical protein
MSLSKNLFAYFLRNFSPLRPPWPAHPRLQLSSNLILRRTPSVYQGYESGFSAEDLGQIYYLEGDYDYGRLHKILTGWRGEIPFYSVVHGGAIHLIDLLLWLTAKTIDHVFAWGNNIATADTPFRHLDCVAALLKFRDGTLAKVTANFASVTPHHHKVCVYGTAGSFVQSHPGATYLMSRDPSQPPNSRSPMPTLAPLRGICCQPLCAQFWMAPCRMSVPPRCLDGDGGVPGDRSIPEHQGQPESVDYGWTISAQIFMKLTRRNW